MTKPANMCVHAKSKHKASSCPKLGHLELSLPRTSCMCMSDQHDRTSTKILCKKACGPFTSGCQSLQIGLVFASVVALSDHRCV